MAVVQLIGFAPTLFTDDNYYSEQGDRWGGAPQATTPTSLDGQSPFQGYMLNWGSHLDQDVLNMYDDMGYSGYTTNFGSHQTNGSINAFENGVYAGYSTNWGRESLIEGERSVNNVDKNSIILHPKDQIIYFKLKGWNPNTQTYETWVITEDITGRPELFDPGRHPPNFDDGIYYTPPSNNQLENITIVARWFQ